MALTTSNEPLFFKSESFKFNSTNSGQLDIDSANLIAPFVVIVLSCKSKTFNFLFCDKPFSINLDIPAGLIPFWYKRTTSKSLWFLNPTAKWFTEPFSNLFLPHTNVFNDGSFFASFALANLNNEPPILEPANGPIPLLDKIKCSMDTAFAI